MEQAYTKRELDKEFGHIKESLEKQDKLLEQILAQTVRTNGRVNKLEGWRQYIAGGLAITGLIGIPALWLIGREVIDNSKTITSHIAQDSKNFNKLNVNN